MHVGLHEQNTLPLDFANQLLWSLTLCILAQTDTPTLAKKKYAPWCINFTGTIATDPPWKHPGPKESSQRVKTMIVFLRFTNMEEENRYLRPLLKTVVEKYIATCTQINSP